MISRRLAEMMGGTVAVRSPGFDGPGSTFQLTLEAPIVGRATPLIPTDLLDGRSILVVDDSDLNRRIIAEHLRSWGAAVTTSSGGEDLLAAIARSGVEAVVLDCPDGAAASTANVVTKLTTTGGGPAIVLTSTAPQRDVAFDPAWFDVGGCGWVSKPIAPLPLARAVCGVLGIDAPEATRRVRHEVAVTPTAARSLSVLVAEDNVMNQTLARTVLERMGHTCAIAPDGRAAVEMATGGNFDVVLMDVEMPEIDGLDGHPSDRGSHGRRRVRGSSRSPPTS